MPVCWPIRQLEAMTPPGMDVEPGAYLAMQQLLKLPQPPDAVFAFNDSAALERHARGQEAGFKMPRDIAFVGFDDIAQAALSHPPLTTLRIDKEELGRIGVDLLLHGADDNRENHILPVDLGDPREHRRRNTHLRLIRGSIPCPTSATVPFLLRPHQ